ncbi:type II secretion system F family protein [Pseudonocardia sp. RS11V-5]|uniref:type II secretion system F family protein n=1 Tax=Pseudonocardia terrae TaxID=2905831 RepID=UPI001E62C10D|nr:type II secretion system F family protein [Pseudonocardia terrae]MCE3555706.1 type II secretion system F family protein [Pseudonocardia terrae]
MTALAAPVAVPAASGLAASAAALPEAPADPAGSPHAVLATSLVLLALAVLVGGAPGARARLGALVATPAGPAEPVVPLRRSWAVVGGLAVAVVVWTVAGGAAAGAGAVVAAVVVGAAGGVGLHLLVTRAAARPARRADGAELAAGWELLATCLEAGLPVPSAAEAAALRIEGEVGAGLRRAAGLLELGSAPAEAWAAVAGVPGLEAFGRAARRSADTGAGLARVARSEAARLRAGLADAAEAKAERAAVLIAAPLGVCFLPAFLALGIAPVVLGLAGEALARW